MKFWTQCDTWWSINALNLTIFSSPFSKANKHELERIFGKYGPLKKIQISRAVPRFALVVFHFQEDAEEAQRKADGSQVFGCYIKVTFARPFTLRHGYQSYNPCLKCGKCGEYGHLLRDCQAKIVIKKELEDVDRGRYFAKK